MVVGKADISGSDRSNEPGTSDNRIQRLFQRLPWMYYSPNRVSAATQTAGVRRSAGTQTEEGEDAEEEHFV